MLTLKTPINQLVGVGPTMGLRLAHLGIETVGELLEYYPRRHDDYSHLLPVARAKVGEFGVFRGKLLDLRNERTPRRRMTITKAILADESGNLPVVWFNQPFLVRNFRLGQEVILAGKVGWNYPGGKVLESPNYERETGILPVYPETEGLTSKYLRRLIAPLLKQSHLFEEFLPEKILKDYRLLERPEAISQIHFPQSIEKRDQARRRLAFEELFLISLRLILIKKELSKERSGAMKIDEKLLQNFVQSLPFRLTEPQRRSAWEIIKDLARSIPMNRLLEGEVGSGKTVVAAMAVLVVAKNGYNANSNWQSVWMAPTEILAFQHYKNVKKLVGPFSLKVALWTSSKKEGSLSDDLVIGTHALIQEGVQFPRLALVIIDEQHRFGVRQRASLRMSTVHGLPFDSAQGRLSTAQKSQAVDSSRKAVDFIPHLLSMTATPIPRTLALALYGDLDISIINQLPVGRKKVETKVIDPAHRQTAYDFIRRQIKQGRQAFVITPLIGEGLNGVSGVKGVNGKKKQINLFEQERKSAVKEYEKLSKHIFPDLEIGLLHGRMKSKEKEKIMKDFAAGRVDILVSTAVVEVGIDVPNASVMMIEGADHFGLAQLHQFRGRVGRSQYQSYCFLFAETWNPATRMRLKAMEQIDNGFALAEKDLEFRGPGELAGIRQSGIPDLKMASLSDIILVKQAREAAEKIAQESLSGYPQLAKKISEFQKERHLE